MLKGRNFMLERKMKEVAERNEFLVERACRLDHPEQATNEQRRRSPEHQIQPETDSECGRSQRAVNTRYEYMENRFLIGEHVRNMHGCINNFNE